MSLRIGWRIWRETKGGGRKGGKKRVEVVRQVFRGDIEICRIRVRNRVRGKVTTKGRGRERIADHG